jgi:predicted Rossmann fold nucleotide-binding protein DprA/Smf involved in DNA uptake
MIDSSGKPNPEGVRRAKFFTRTLVDNSITVPAQGIDTIAHEKAIAVALSFFQNEAEDSKLT